MTSWKTLFSVKKVDLSVNRFDVVERFYSTFAMSKTQWNEEWRIKNKNENYRMKQLVITAIMIVLSACTAGAQNEGMVFIEGGTF